MRTRRSLIAALAGLALLAGCQSPTPTAENSSASASASAGGEVVLLSHDSFDFPQELLDQFKKDTGITVTIQQVGDGGELANKLVLTKDAPLGDAVYGLDNTVSYRLKGKEIIDDAGKMDSAQDLAYADEPGLVPIDHGQVCVNLDKKWFADKGLTPPASFDDLTKPEYKDQLVAMNPTSSTPGMAFMLATVHKYGEDGWLDYWKQLKANGVKITQGWSDAFSIEYSAGEGAGAYPMMVSYGSSPAYSVNDEGTDTSTAAILDTCYPQVEYAGVLKGAKNPEGAKKFIEFMLTAPVQEAISDVTYMYPVTSDAKVPEKLEKFGPLSDKATQVEADKIADHADEWLRAWQADVIG